MRLLCLEFLNIVSDTSHLAGTPSLLTLMLYALYATCVTLLVPDADADVAPPWQSAASSIGRRGVVMQ